MIWKIKTAQLLKKIMEAQIQDEFFCIVTDGWCSGAHAYFNVFVARVDGGFIVVPERNVVFYSAMLTDGVLAEKALAVDFAGIKRIECTADEKGYENVCIVPYDGNLLDYKFAVGSKGGSWQYEIKSTEFVWKGSKLVCDDESILVTTPETILGVSKACGVETEEAAYISKVYHDGVNVIPMYNAVAR